MLALYTFFTYRQATIMRSQLDVLDKQTLIAQSQLRAQAGILGVTGFPSYPLEVGQMKRIAFQLENPRPTPAQIVACKMAVGTRRATEPSPDIDTVAGPTDFCDGSPDPCGGTVVHSLYLRMNPGKVLTENDIRQIRAGTLLLYFVGHVQYKDGIEPDELRVLSFCRVYDPDMEWQDCSTAPASK